MGFFDRFKKKQDEPSIYGRSTDFSPEPLSLRHSDGRTDKVYFHDLIDIDGKQLKAIALEQGGVMGRKTYYIEPVYGRDEKGNIIDITEDHYKGLVAQGGLAFVAVKGFFQPRDITKEKIGSNYIGGVSFNEQTGKYFRGYDEEFRQKYIARTRQQDMEQAEMKQQQESRERAKRKAMIEEGRRKQMIETIATQTQDGTEYDLSHPRRGEAAVLSQEDRPNRYSQMI